MDGLGRPVGKVKGLACGATFAAAMFAAIPAAAAPTSTLRLADLRKAVSLSSPQISPDGRRVLVLVSRRDYQKDVTVTDLDLVDVQTRAARSLLRDAHVRVARWAPNGGAIAYVAEPKSGDEKSPQLFVLPMDGGEPLALTHEKKGVTDFAWRPDSRALAYVATAEAPNAKQIEQHDDAFQVTDEAWTAQAAPVPDRLYEMAATGGTAHRIASWSWSVAGGLTYSADGRSLFVTRVKPNAHPNRYLASEIVEVGVADGRVALIPALSPTLGDPIRSFDGRFIAYAFANPRAAMQTEAALADANGSHPRFVTARLNRNLSVESFVADDAFAVAADDGTRRRLFRVGADGAVSALPLGDVDVLSASAARDGTVALTGYTPDHPTELYVLHPHAAALERLTRYNDWIGGFALGKSRTIAWRSSDGLHPDGVLTSPPNWRAGRRAPLVLFIHGGPTAASNTGYSGSCKSSPRTAGSSFNRTIAAATISARNSRARPCRTSRAYPDAISKTARRQS